jgi:hypothetical protein
MPFRNPNNNQNGLEEVIDRALFEMQDFDSGSEEFARIVDQLDKLFKMKAYGKNESSLNMNSLLAVIGNVVGIFSILGYEKAHVVTSKAISFVMKAHA